MTQKPTSIALKNKILPNLGRETASNLPRYREDLLLLQPLAHNLQTDGSPTEDIRVIFPHDQLAKVSRESTRYRRCSQRWGYCFTYSFPKSVDPYHQPVHAPSTSPYSRQPLDRPFPPAQ